MNIAQVATSSTAANISRHIQADTEMQMAVLKQMAESQQQMAEMLHILGVGLKVDIQA